MGLRQILEATYEGRLTAYRRIFAEKEGRTVQEEVLLLKNVPCALSWGGGMRKRGAAVKQELVPRIRDEARVFLPPDVELPAGCRVVISQHGTTREFISSGEGVVYPTHQEVVLTREGTA